MDSSTAIHYAQLVAFPSAFLLAGYSFSFSQNSVRQLYDVRPQISTPVFARVFYSGAAVIIPGVLLSAASSAYLAYMQPERRRLWITAAVSVLATQPWTAIVMMSGIRRLLEISESGPAVLEKVEQTLEYRQLLNVWVRQNFVRAGMFFVGGIAGLTAAMGA